MILRYRRAHCCSNVARRAQVRLITKLKNQSALTKTAWFGGEKGSGEAGLFDPFGSASILSMLARYIFDVSCEFGRIS